MSYLPINLDPLSTNARIQALEVQIVDSGEMNTDLRDYYLYIFNCRVHGQDVETDLVALETEIRKRSIDSRTEVEQFVHFLFGHFGTTNVALTRYLPMFPDSVDEHNRLQWNFNLTTPLRWADQGMPPGVLTHYNRWVPPTHWLPPQPTQLRIAAAPFVPQGTITTAQPAGYNIASGSQLATIPAFQIFRPSRVLLGQPRLLSSQFLEQARSMGFDFNPNYEGSIDHFTVQNASCPEDKNCSLFITNVNSIAATSEFFDQIHEGVIFSCHKKAPAGAILTSAISLVFTTRQSAVAFYNRLQNQGMFIRGDRLRVTWNRERVRPVAPDAAHQTRVLRMTGPANQMTLGDIIQYLHDNIDFTVTHKGSSSNGQGIETFEIGFGSIRGQSRNAMKCLATWLGNQWRIEYAPDPCSQ